MSYRDAEMRSIDNACNAITEEHHQYVAVIDRNVTVLIRAETLADELRALGWHVERPRPRT